MATPATAVADMVEVDLMADPTEADTHPTIKVAAGTAGSRTHLRNFLIVLCAWRNFHAAARPPAAARADLILTPIKRDTFTCNVTPVVRCAQTYFAFLPHKLNLCSQI